MISNNFDGHIQDAFSPAIGQLKLRYADYDESLTNKDFLVPTDKINIFISLETAFKHISMIREVERKLTQLQSEGPNILISGFLNLAQHYKRFFTNYGLDTRVYLYQTAFDSTTFPQKKYNEYYRSYYLTKFNDNPRFAPFTEMMEVDVIPDIKEICNFIPGVYYITAKDMEGSIVPYVIAKSDVSRKNLMLTGEAYDTQYGLLDNFVAHFIHRFFKVNKTGSSVRGYINILEAGKNDNDLDYLSTVYNHYNFYVGLLAVMGDRSRSIDGLSGIGPKTFADAVMKALHTNTITETVANPEVLGDIFMDNKEREEFINNYKCSNILQMYDELTDGQKKSIIDQQIDRSDNNSLYTLNATRFQEHPIILEGLL